MLRVADINDLQAGGIGNIGRCPRDHNISGARRRIHRAHNGEKLHGADGGQIRGKRGDLDHNVFATRIGIHLEDKGCFSLRIRYRIYLRTPGRRLRGWA